jgi:murein DD-endopeptidase MepM/ murein hydrolase activator NlpD
MKTHTTKKHLRIIVTSIIVMVLISLSFTFTNSVTETVPNVKSSLVNQAVSDDNPPSIPPIDLSKVKMTSGFGMRMHPIQNREVMHRGVDLAAAAGTSVFATANGKVTQTGFEENGAGHYIIIHHDNKFETFYSQLNEILVKTDQEVTKGSIIGKVGSSGLSTGPHLHYEVRLNGEAVDPSKYFE